MNMTSNPHQPKALISECGRVLIVRPTAHHSDWHIHWTEDGLFHETTGGQSFDSAADKADEIRDLISSRAALFRDLLVSAGLTGRLPSECFLAYLAHRDRRESDQ